MNKISALLFSLFVFSSATIVPLPSFDKCATVSNIVTNVGVAGLFLFTKKSDAIKMQQAGWAMEKTDWAILGFLGWNIYTGVKGLKNLNAKRELAQKFDAIREVERLTAQAKSDQSNAQLVLTTPVTA